MTQHFSRVHDKNFRFFIVSAVEDGTHARHSLTFAESYYVSGSRIKWPKIGDLGEKAPRAKLALLSFDQLSTQEVVTP